MKRRFTQQALEDYIEGKIKRAERRYGFKASTSYSTVKDTEAEDAYIEYRELERTLDQLRHYSE